MQCGRALAAIDVLAGWAALAASHDYVRPRMSLNGPMAISQGRHPVVEQMLPAGEFVPNDLLLDDHEQQVIIITGPNMAGKVHHPAPGSPDQPAGPGRVLCARRKR